MKNFLKYFLSLIALLQITIFTPMQARADLMTDVFKAVELAGYWPTDLPPPDALMDLISKVQDCTSKNQDVTTCANAIIDNSSVSDSLGDSKEKIELGLDVYGYIQSGDYISIIKVLGKAAGCVAAAIIVGVPVCTLAQALADIAGAVADVGKEIYEFLQEVGASAVWSGDDYYDVYYSPKVELGMKINLFTPEGKLAATFGELSGPLYHGCVDLISKHKSDAATHEICEFEQNRFVSEINSGLVNLQNKAKDATGVEYDNKSVNWRKIWEPQCELSSGAAINVDDLIDACKKKVQEALAIGRNFATAYLPGYVIENTLLYDAKGAAEAGYQNWKTQKVLVDAVKDNQKIEKDYAFNPNSGPAVLQKIKYEIESFNKDTAAWQSQCNFGDFTNDCKYELKQAWYDCQKKIAQVPLISGDLQMQDTEKVNAVVQKCQDAYTALITTYTNFSSKRGLVYGFGSEICPKENQASGVLFMAASTQCKKDVELAVNKCSGGIPAFTPDYYSTNKMLQKPEPVKNCQDETQFLKDKWGKDEPLYEQVTSAYNQARLGCNNNLECVNAVKAKTDECTSSIGAQANALGLIVTAPANMSKIKTAGEKMISSTTQCLAEINNVSANFFKAKAFEEYVLNTYGNQCPPNEGPKMMYADDCKKELIQVAVSCQKPAGKGIARLSKTKSGIQQIQTTDSLMQEKLQPCKFDLMTVIDQFQKKASNAKKNLQTIQGAGSVPGNVMLPSQGLPTAPAAAQTAANNKTFKVTATAAMGGSIAPMGVQSVNSGKTMTFTITANAGFKIKSVTGCGAKVKMGNLYETEAITGDCSLSVAFEKTLAIQGRPTMNTIPSAGAIPPGAIMPHTTSPASSTTAPIRMMPVQPGLIKKRK